MQSARCETTDAIWVQIVATWNDWTERKALWLCCTPASCDTHKTADDTLLHLRSKCLFCRPFRRCRRYQVLNCDWVRLAKKTCLDQVWHSKSRDDKKQLTLNKTTVQKKKRKSRSNCCVLKRTHSTVLIQDTRAGRDIDGEHERKIKRQSVQNLDFSVLFTHSLKIFSNQSWDSTVHRRESASAIVRRRCVWSASSVCWAELRHPSSSPETHPTRTTTSRQHVTLHLILKHDAQGADRCLRAGLHSSHDLHLGKDKVSDIRGDTDEELFMCPGSSTLSYDGKWRFSEELSSLPSLTPASLIPNNEDWTSVSRYQRHDDVVDCMSERSWAFLLDDKCPTRNSNRHEQVRNVSRKRQSLPVTCTARREDYHHRTQQKNCTRCQ